MQRAGELHEDWRRVPAAALRRSGPIALVCPSPGRALRPPHAARPDTEPGARAVGARSCARGLRLLSVYPHPHFAKILKNPANIFPTPASDTIQPPGDSVFSAWIRKIHHEQTNRLVRPLYTK